jgi:uncharacterized protein (DUF1697 family)
MSRRLSSDGGERILAPPVSQNHPVLAPESGIICLRHRCDERSRRMGSPGRLQTYIALFRGINVGGRHALPMKELKAVLEEHGCVDVRTYIQSGNAVLRSALSDAAHLAARVAAAVSASHGFEPAVLVLTPRELERAATGNPFPRAAGNPRSLHLFFLAATPKRPDLESLATLRARSERFELKGRVFYLYTPDGFGTSRLAGRAERLLGVEATARNWRTVTTLLEMAAAAR